MYEHQLVIKKTVYYCDYYTIIIINYNYELFIEN